MKQLLTAFLLVFTGTVFAQSNPNPHRIFNCTTTREEKVNDYTLVSNFYTLRDNIENKESMVFVAEHPTLDQVTKAALTLPSNLFGVIKGPVVTNTILVLAAGKLVVRNRITGAETTYDAPFHAGVTQERADEMIKEKYDPKAKIVDSILFFNNKKLKIVSTVAVKQAVLALIDKARLTRVEAVPVN